MFKHVLNPSGAFNKKRQQDSENSKAGREQPPPHAAPGDPVAAEATMVRDILDEGTLRPEPPSPPAPLLHNHRLLFSTNNNAFNASGSACAATANDLNMSSGYANVVQVPKLRAATNALLDTSASNYLDLSAVSGGASGNNNLLNGSSRLSSRNSPASNQTRTTTTAMDTSRENGSRPSTPMLPGGSPMALMTPFMRIVEQPTRPTPPPPPVRTTRSLKTPNPNVSGHNLLDTLPSGSSRMTGALRQQPPSDISFNASLAMNQTTPPGNHSSILSPIPPHNSTMVVAPNQTFSMKEEATTRGRHNYFNNVSSASSSSPFTAGLAAPTRTYCGSKVNSTSLNHSKATNLSSISHHGDHASKVHHQVTTRSFTAAGNCSFTKTYLQGKEAVRSLSLLCICSTILAVGSLVFLLKLAPVQAWNPAGKVEEGPAQGQDGLPAARYIAYEVAIGTAALTMCLNLFCMLTCSLQIVIAVKLVKVSRETSRGVKYLNEATTTRLSAIACFFGSIPVFLISVIMYIVAFFDSTSAVVISTTIGLTILFCGLAMFHNVLIWLKKSRAPSLEPQGAAANFNLPKLTNVVANGGTRISRTNNLEGGCKATDKAIMNLPNATFDLSGPEDLYANRNNVSYSFTNKNGSGAASKSAHELSTLV